VNKRGIAAVTGLWLATVALASALTWSVISLAGARVGQPAGVALPTPATTTDSARNPGSWSGSGGKVTARCTGEEIALVAATPADGYSVEVKDRGPTQLQLEFERRGASAESRVSATCVAGVPVFTKV
jgi:hypothetical protein